jgi:hypothetical protein
MLQSNKRQTSPAHENAKLSTTAAVVLNSYAVLDPLLPVSLSISDNSILSKTIIN